LSRAGVAGPGWKPRSVNVPSGEYTISPPGNRWPPIERRTRNKACSSSYQYSLRWSRGCVSPEARSTMVACEPVFSTTAWMTGRSPSAASARSVASALFCHGETRISTPTAALIVPAASRKPPFARTGGIDGDSAPRALPAPQERRHAPALGPLPSAWEACLRLSPAALQVPPASVTSSRDRSSASARARRECTVPRGMPRISAISGGEWPSQ
jgi:hypothetical protein